MQTVTVIETSQKAVDTINSIKAKISNSPTGVSFFGVKNYTNKSNETSNYTINLGVDYGKCKEADIALLTQLDVTTLEGKKSSSIDLELARVALLNALINPNEVRSAAQTDAYEVIAPNVKRHLTNDKLYIFGSKVHKKVLVAGVYKTVNSSALTIAKNELRQMLKTAKCRQYILDLYTLDFELFVSENEVNPNTYGNVSLEVED